MAVDADDLVSNRLAEFFKGRNDEKCYTSAFGYMWIRGRKWLTKHKDLYRTCGSCSVIYYTQNELPDQPFEKQDKENKFIFQVSHRLLPSRAKEFGKTFGVIPFPTTVYVLGTGENHSTLKNVGISYKRTIEGLLFIPRIISKKLKSEYNL